MNGKFAYIMAAFILIAFVSGCISEESVVPDQSGGQCNAPKKMIGEVCCYDQNSNDICDIEEAGCPDSCDDDNACSNDTCSASTNFECVHTMNYPCCGNDVCEKNEEYNNICPEDCVILDVTDFQLLGEKAFIEDGAYQFIHTVSASPIKFFRLNITAGKGGMEDIRYTFTCNSTQHADLDSINSEAYNETDDIEEKLNLLETADYRVYTNFFNKQEAGFERDIEELNQNGVAYFNFKIEKINPLKRDDLTCLVKLYFIEPKKILYKWLEISYI